jgi:cytochrome P450
MLRNELEANFSTAVREGRSPTVEEIINTKLPYLDAVIEEMLRLRAAMLVPRDATRNTQLLGCDIPMGTVVLLVCQEPDLSGESTSKHWSEFKHAKRYPGADVADRDVFDPERWLVRHDNGNVEFDGTSTPQLAFGIGVRACWGRKLAMLEMKMMTAMVILKFDLLDVPAALTGDKAYYDLSYRPYKGYLRLRSQ